MTPPVPSSERQPGGGDEYLTAPEAARLLKVSPTTVWRWIKAGRLPALRVGERSVRLKRADLSSVIRPAQEGKGAGAPPEAHQPAVLTGRRGPLSAAEVKKRLAALEQANASRAEQLARRGGRPYSSSTGLVDEARAELSRRS